MNRLAISLAAGLVLQTSPAGAEPPAPTMSGTARVIDGDTISIRDQRIRLAAIDACEVDQSGTRGGAEWPCSKIERSFMRSIADGKHITRRVIDTCSGLPT